MVEGIKMRVVAVTPLQQQQSQLSVTICIPYYYLTFYNSKEKCKLAYCMEIREKIMLLCTCFPVKTLTSHTHPTIVSPEIRHNFSSFSIL